MLSHIKIGMAVAHCPWQLWCVWWRCRNGCLHHQAHRELLCEWALPGPSIACLVWHTVSLLVSVVPQDVVDDCETLDNDEFKRMRFLLYTLWVLWLLAAADAAIEKMKKDRARPQLRVDNRARP
jgi:hypothetical protein